MSALQTDLALAASKKDEGAIKSHSSQECFTLKMMAL
jgi:hypothetical protein